MPGQLLGEGVLTTIDDARRRLLHPRAAIIPSGAEVYAVPVQMRVATRAGFALDDLNLFSTDMSLAPKSSTGCKLQNKPASDGDAVLGAPLSLFTFDFAKADLRAYLVGRQRDDLLLRFDRPGILTAMLIYFDLHCDGEHTFCSGPTNSRLTAWDQNLRSLPVEVRVNPAITLPMVAEHNHEAVRVGLPHLHPSMVEGTVGHHELLGQPAQPISGGGS